MSSLSTVLAVFTVASVALTVGTVLINIRLAERRSWIVSAIRAGATVLAAILALPITKLLAGFLTDVSYQLVMPVLGDDIGDLVGASSEGLEGTGTVTSMMVSLVTYILVFLLLQLGFVLAGVAACRFLPALRERARRGVALTFGVCNGLLAALVILSSVCAFLTVSGHTLGDTTASIDTYHAEQTAGIVQKFNSANEDERSLSRMLDRHPLVSLLSSTVGRPLLAVLGNDQIRLEDENEIVELNLDREMSVVVRTATHLTDAGAALEKEDFCEDDKARLYGLSDSMTDSRWMSVVSADAVVVMAENWKQGKPFGGMNAPVAVNAARPAFDCLMDTMAASEADALREDLHVLFDVMGDLKIAGLLSETDDVQLLICNAARDDLFCVIDAKLAVNSRFDPLAAEMRLMSVRLLADLLGKDALLAGEHSALMRALAADLTAGGENTVSAMEETLAAYGYELPENVAKVVAEQILADLGSDGAISEIELTTYLSELA